MTKRPRPASSLQEGVDLPRVESGQLLAPPDRDMDLRVVRGVDRQPAPSDLEGSAPHWPNPVRLEDLSSVARDITIRVADRLPAQFDVLQLNYLRLVSLVRWSDRALHEYQSARTALLGAPLTAGDRVVVVQSFGGCLASLSRAARLVAMLRRATASNGEGDDDLLPGRLLALHVDADGYGSFTRAAAAADDLRDHLPTVTKDGLAAADQFLSFDQLAAALRSLDARVDQLLSDMMGITRAGGARPKPPDSASAQSPRPRPGTEAIEGASEGHRVRR